MRRPTTQAELVAVFDAFANGALPVEEFDEALWSFLCARIPGDEASFQTLAHSRSILLRISIRGVGGRERRVCTGRPERLIDTDTQRWAP